MHMEPTRLRSLRSGHRGARLICHVRRSSTGARMDQNKMYSLLVDDRQACRLCAGLVNPSAVDNGVHDAAEVGPWTTWQGNLKAKVLLVGQDYSDVAYFVRNGGR